MKLHVNNVVKSCNYQLRQIGRARRFLTYEATEKVIHAFLSSRLDCGNSLLYGLPDNQITKLQRVQNIAARILTKTRKHEHISPILQQLHWLPVSKRINIKIITLTFKCLHDKAPSYLQDLIVLQSPARVTRSSDKCLLQVPNSKHITMGDRSFAVAAPTLWNRLPDDIRMCDSYSTFKSKLMTYLLKQ